MLCLKLVKLVKVSLGRLQLQQGQVDTNFCHQLHFKKCTLILFCGVDQLSKSIHFKLFPAFLYISHFSHFLVLCSKNLPSSLLTKPSLAWPGTRLNCGLPTLRLSDSLPLSLPGLSPVSLPPRRDSDSLPLSLGVSPQSRSRALPPTPGLRLKLPQQAAKVSPNCLCKTIHCWRPMTRVSSSYSSYVFPIMVGCCKKSLSG